MSIPVGGGTKTTELIGSINLRMGGARVAGETFCVLCVQHQEWDISLINEFD